MRNIQFLSFVVLLATATILGTGNTVLAGPPERPGATGGGTVAIGTWPTPERPITGFRFESFFLDQLRAAGAIDSQADLNARFRLAVEAVKLADSVGYFFDRVPEVCLSEFPPPWCPYAGGVIIDGRILIVDSLIANGALLPESGGRWRNIARNRGFMEFAPTLFGQIKAAGWSAQKALELLDRSFAAVSGAAYPAPDSYWERYCREHPEDPICWVIHEAFSTEQGRNLARELVFVSRLQQEKLLSGEQTRAIYDLYSGNLPRPAGGVIVDLYPYPIPAGGIITALHPIPAGIIIVDGLKLDPKQRNAILVSLATNRVGLVDPDSPWADICFQENPPPICKFISTFPLAATLTTQLVKHKLWTRDAALKAWNQLWAAVGRREVTGLSTRQKAPR